jgi:hypothetical protein
MFFEKFREPSGTMPETQGQSKHPQIRTAENKPMLEVSISKSGIGDFAHSFGLKEADARLRAYPKICLFERWGTETTWPLDLRFGAKN